MSTNAEEMWDSYPGARRTTGSAAGGRQAAQGKSQKQLDAEGIDVYGHPQSATRYETRGNGSGGGRRATSIQKSLAAWQSGELSDQHDLHDFLEAGRSLCRELSVYAELAAGELEAGAKEMMRGTGHRGLFGLDIRMKVRRVTKKLSAVADDLAAASAGCVSTWKAFEKEFEEELNGSKTQVTKPKHFQISES